MNHQIPVGHDDGATVTTEPLTRAAIRLAALHEALQAIMSVSTNTGYASGVMAAFDAVIRLTKTPPPLDRD